MRRKRTSPELNGLDELRLRRALRLEAGEPTARARTPEASLARLASEYGLTVDELLSWAATSDDPGLLELIEARASVPAHQ